MSLFPDTLHFNSLQLFIPKNWSLQNLTSTFISHKEHPLKFSYQSNTSIIHNLQNPSFQKSPHLIINKLIQIVHIMQSIHLTTHTLTPSSITQFSKHFYISNAQNLLQIHTNINFKCQIFPLNILLTSFKSSYFLPLWPIEYLWNNDF